jgi:hypothetical protein
MIKSEFNQKSCKDNQKLKKWSSGNNQEKKSLMFSLNRLQLHLILLNTWWHFIAIVESRKWRCEFVTCKLGMSKTVPMFLYAACLIKLLRCCPSSPGTDWPIAVLRHILASWERNTWRAPVADRVILNGAPCPCLWSDRRGRKPGEALLQSTPLVCRFCCPKMPKDLSG